MVEQNSKHGPARDELLARIDRVPGSLGAGSHLPGGPQEPAAPAGMTPEDVEGRFELARFLGRAVFPGDREQLARAAVEHGAPDEVIDVIRALPPGERFGSMQDLARAIGLGTERR
jgi:hypothetical protein